MRVIRCDRPAFSFVRKCWKAKGFAFRKTCALSFPTCCGFIRWASFCSGFTINHTVDLLDKLIHLASNPFMRPLRKQALRLIDELRDVAESIDDEEVKE